MTRFITVILEIEIPETVLPDIARQTILSPFYASSLRIHGIRLFEGMGKSHELTVFSDQGPL